MEFGVDFFKQCEDNLVICTSCVFTFFPPCFLMCTSIKDSEGQQIVVPYRYNVGALPSNKTNCFKPNPLANGFDHEQHKQWSLGAIYLGSMGKVFRQENNKNAALLWEAPGRLLKVPFLFNPCVAIPPSAFSANHPENSFSRASSYFCSL